MYIIVIPGKDKSPGKVNKQKDKPMKRKDERGAPLRPGAELPVATSTPVCNGPVNKSIADFRDIWSPLNMNLGQGRIAQANPRDTKSEMALHTPLRGSRDQLDRAVEKKHPTIPYPYYTPTPQYPTNRSRYQRGSGYESEGGGYKSDTGGYRRRRTEQHDGYSSDFDGARRVQGHTRSSGYSSDVDSSARRSRGYAYRMPTGQDFPGYKPNASYQAASGSQGYMAPFAGSQSQISSHNDPNAPFVLRTTIRNDEMYSEPQNAPTVPPKVPSVTNLYRDRHSRPDDMDGSHRNSHPDDRLGRHSNSHPESRDCQIRNSHSDSRDCQLRNSRSDDRDSYHRNSRPDDRDSHHRNSRPDDQDPSYRTGRPDDRDGSHKNLAYQASEFDPSQRNSRPDDPHSNSRPSDGRHDDRNLPNNDGGMYNPPPPYKPTPPYQNGARSRLAADSPDPEVTRYMSRQEALASVPEDGSPPDRLGPGGGQRAAGTRQQHGGGDHSRGNSYDDHFPNPNDPPPPASRLQELQSFDDIIMYKSPEPTSQVSSSTDSGYGHGHPLYERVHHDGRTINGRSHS